MTFLDKLRRRFRRQLRDWLLSILQEGELSSETTAPRAEVAADGAPRPDQIPAPSTNGPPAHWVELVKDAAPELLRPPPHRATDVPTGQRRPIGSRRSDGVSPDNVQPPDQYVVSERPPRRQAVPMLRSHTERPALRHEPAHTVLPSAVSAPGATVRTGNPSPMADYSRSAAPGSPDDVEPTVSPKRATPARQAALIANPPRDGALVARDDHADHTGDAGLVRQSEGVRPVELAASAAKTSLQTVSLDEHRGPELPPASMQRDAIIDGPSVIAPPLQRRETETKERIARLEEVAPTPQAGTVSNPTPVAMPPIRYNELINRWPDLPEEPAAVEPDWNEQLGEAERLRRIDLEQRGRGRWSE